MNNEMTSEVQSIEIDETIKILKEIVSPSNPTIAVSYIPESNVYRVVTEGIGMTEFEEIKSRLGLSLLTTSAEKDFKVAHSFWDGKT